MKTADIFIVRSVSASVTALQVCKSAPSAKELTGSKDLTIL